MMQPRREGVEGMLQSTAVVRGFSMVPDSFLYRNSSVSAAQPTHTAERIPATCLCETSLELRSKHIPAWQGYVQLR